jgi:electron transfer flavoprotein alpha subunit
MSSANLDYEGSAATVPAINTLKKQSMPNFIVIGQSGAGKTILATRLAAELGCKLVNAATLSERVENDETNEVFIRVFYVFIARKFLGPRSRGCYCNIPREFEQCNA